MNGHDPTGDATRHQEASQLFGRLRGLDREAQDALLSSEPQLSEEVIRRARDLLAWDETTGFLEGGSPLSRKFAGSPAPELDSGVRVADFTVDEVLGRGGMGTVYRARQDLPSREVALKILGGHALHAATGDWIRTEAESLGRMQHGNVASIFSAGVQDLDGAPIAFVAMELIRGVSLLEHAQQQRADFDRRLDLLLQTVEGVVHAHGVGVVHQDLKPANILVAAEGRVKIIDFGISALLDQLDRQPALARFVGTPRYMAPERLDPAGPAVEPTSDIYALGLIGRELLDPVLHELGSGSALLRSVRWTDVQLVLSRAMATDPADRFQTARELGSELERVRARLPIALRDHSWTYRAVCFLQRHTLGCALAAGALLVLGAGALAYADKSRRFNSAADQADRTALFLFDYLELTGASYLGNEQVGEQLEELGVFFERHFNGAPELEIPVRARLGQQLRSAGHLNEARAQLLAALDLVNRNPRIEPKFELIIRLELAMLLTYHETDPEALADSIDYLRAHLSELDGEDYGTLELRVQGLRLLASDHSVRGAWEQAHELLLEAVALQDLLGPVHSQIVQARRSLHRTLPPDQSVARARELLADCAEALGPSERLTLIARYSLAEELGRAWEKRNSNGTLDEMLTLLESVIQDRTVLLGPSAPGTLNARIQRAATLARQGKTDLALTELERIGLDTAASLPPGHPLHASVERTLQATQADAEDL